MLVDLVLRGVPIAEISARAGRLEALGFDGVGVTETNGNPFLAAAQAAGGTSHVRILTAVALAFPRSPMDLAYTTWVSGSQRRTLALGLEPRCGRMSSVASAPPSTIRRPG